MELHWKTKGIVLTAPLSEEVDDVVKFIDELKALSYVMEIIR